MKRRPADTTLDKCKIHQSVLDLCLDDLTNQQVFNKERVLSKLNLLGVSAAIYWDYIRRRIETGFDDGNGHAISLLPVSHQFFKRQRKANMSLNSLLAGPGGKAAGFALATIDGGQIALASITLRANQASGADAANKNSRRCACQLSRRRCRCQGDPGQGRASIDEKCLAECCA